MDYEGEKYHYENVPCCPSDHFALLAKIEVFTESK